MADDTWSTANELFFLRGMTSLPARINYYYTTRNRVYWGNIDKKEVIKEARKVSREAQRELEKLSKSEIDRYMKTIYKTDD